MKRIFTIVVLIASLGFTSCEDFLTEDVRGQLNVLLSGHDIWRIVANQQRVVTFRNVWR